MKPSLIATLIILWLGLGPANKAQAQIVYGNSVPFENGGVDSSGMSNNLGAKIPGNIGSSGMMYPWGKSSWNSWNSRLSTAGSSSSFQSPANRMWSNQWSGSNQWNGFGRGGDSFQPNMSMTRTSMNSGFGGMNSMGMRRR
jgi:hypothetical protein